MHLKHRALALAALLGLLAGPLSAHAELAEALRADRINRNPASAQTPLPVSGRVTKITVAPTVTSGAAYASGNVVGSLMTFAGAGTTDPDGNLDNAGGLIQSVTINFKSAQTAGTDFVWCGSSNLPGSTITDKAAVNVAVSDFAACKVVHVTDCTNLGTPSICTATGLAIPFLLDTGSSGFAFLVTRGTPTFTATTDVSVKLEIVR